MAKHDRGEPERFALSQRISGAPHLGQIAIDGILVAGRQGREEEEIAVGTH
jgi:hypothetical protein